MRDEVNIGLIWGDGRLSPLLSPLHTIVPCVPIVPKPLFAWIFSGTMAGTMKSCVPERIDVRSEIALMRCRGRHWRPARGYAIYVNPSVTACAVPAPRKGEPFGALYKLTCRFCNKVYHFTKEQLEAILKEGAGNSDERSDTE